MTHSTTLNQMSQMKFHGMLETYRTVLQSNQHHDLEPDQLVDLLIQAEWEERENRKIKRLQRAAKFRYQAAVEEVDFTAQRGLDKTQFLRLTDMGFIKRRENILITGATGSGKSFLASALGHQACLQGVKTLYYNCSKLFPNSKCSKLMAPILKKSPE